MGLFPSSCSASFLDGSYPCIARSHCKTATVSQSHLISALEFPIVLVAFLDRVIREMDEPVGDILSGELLAGCSEISILVEVASHVSIDTGDHRITSYVEFPSMEK